MSIAALASGGVAAAAAAAAYLDGRYQIRKDVGIILKMKRAEREYQRRVKQNRISPWYVFEEACLKHGPHRAIWTRDGSWTYTELYAQTVRYARWMAEEGGVRPGDLVALYLTNSAEFLMLVFAAHCLGASAAPVNYNLEGKALVHCLDVCESKLLFVDGGDEGCVGRVEGVRGEVEGRGVRIVRLDEGFKREIGGRSADVVPGDEWRRGVKGSFPFVLIFTSGTTGMPKGCVFTTSRMHLLGSHITPPFGNQPGRDVWYSSMPLYHGTAFMAVSCGLYGGIGCALAPRFSVSAFWPDVHASGATLFVYVGETARYLLSAPAHPLERAHKLRLAYGNGLRPDVWERMQERFGIPEVNEFFSSSEGVFSLSVWDRGEYLRGTVGHHGGVLRLLLRDRYVPVLVDYETGDIWRDPDTGFARRMPYEVGGEMLVKVPGRDVFGGYWNNEGATEKRFATDVFTKGDLYYRSGDALRRTEDGHWYFLDRLGDTFRWKSENVSTAEVAEVLGGFPGVEEANVYGVSVPNHEGRAGCAAIRLDDQVEEGGFDYAALLAYARGRLPKYAVPVFLRVTRRTSHIHNHKQNKVPLRKEGVDPDLVGTSGGGTAEDGGDVILWVAPGGGGKDGYVNFQRTDWDGLKGGKARL